MSRDNLAGLSIDDFVYENMYEDWGIDNQKDKGKNRGLFRDVDNLAGENMSINNISDKQSNAADKLQSDAHKSTEQPVDIPDKQSDATDKLKSDTRKKFSLILC